MTRLFFRLLALLCGLSLMITAYANEAGAEKSETCRGCHGIEGYKNVYPTYKVPKLAGQNKEYLVIALKAYQSGERAHPTMRSQAATLSDKDIEDISAFFAGQGGGEK